MTTKKSREITSHFASARIVDKRGGGLTRDRRWLPYRCEHEKELAERFDSLGVKFSYESQEFKVYIDDVALHWIPDFYLPESDEYIELCCGKIPLLKKKKIEAFKKQYPKVSLKLISKSAHMKI